MWVTMTCFRKSQNLLPLITFVVGSRLQLPPFTNEIGHLNSIKDGVAAAVEIFQNYSPLGILDQVKLDSCVVRNHGFPVAIL